jgi:hypothetical protein
VAHRQEADARQGGQLLGQGRQPSDRHIQQLQGQRAKRAAGAQLLQGRRVCSGAPVSG